jgi:hypothetical protein
LVAQPEFFTLEPSKFPNVAAIGAMQKTFIVIETGSFLIQTHAYTTEELVSEERSPEGHRDAHRDAAEPSDHPMKTS